MLDDVLHRSALAQSQLIRGGALSVEELTRAYLERIERIDPRLSAFVHRAFEGAVASARGLDRARRRDPGALRGPLWGLPTAMKDIHMVRGMAMRLGSRAFRHVWSPVDDVSTTAVRRAGMVLTGKLATSELAILPFIDTELHPPTRNPWDLTRYAGGSSGGSSAAIAAGMLPIAVASDGGGSIRIPAAFCGLVGHKPSRGLLPNPFARFEPLELAVVGPHARSVDDAAALLDVLHGPGLGALESIARPPAPLRIRFTTRNPVVATEPAIAAAVHRAARVLESLGHHVQEGEPIQGQVDDFMPMYFFLARNMFVPFEGALQETTRWLRQRGDHVSLQDAMTCRSFFHDLVDRWFEGVDLWISPTVASHAPPVGTWDSESPEGRMFASAPLGAFTAPFNASGNPATTIPLWLDGASLPAGIQLIAPRGQDLRALATARTLLEALGTPLTPLAPLA